MEVWAWEVDLPETFEGLAKYRQNLHKLGNGSPNFLNKLYTYSNLDLSRFDAVLACGFPAYFAALRNPNVTWKVMTTPGYHNSNNPARKLLLALEKRAVNRCRDVIVDSGHMQQVVRQAYGRQSTIIPHGIDVDSFRTGKDNGYFLHVSRLTPEKCVDALVRAWDNGLPLKIAGTGPQEYVQSLKKLAQGKPITFTGSIDSGTLRKLYSHCTAVVFASVGEPFGLVLIEGMASGKPLIAMDSGGPKDIIKPGFGFLCKDHAEIARKASWLAKHPAKAGSMGATAKAKSRAYAAGKYYKKILKVLSA